MTGKLSLGPLPNQVTVRITIAVNASLKERIDGYAVLHAETWGERDAPDAAVLIPHIIETFLARDRKFRKWRRSDAGRSEMENREDAGDNRGT
jgi:hypothetical protein